MDIKARIAEQITLGHRAGELFANPAFEQVVHDLAVKYYEEFRAVRPDNTIDLLIARLKIDILEQLVGEMERMFVIGRNNSQNTKGTTND